MKIVLIEPKSPNYHVYSAFSMPRLGLPLIGAILKSKGHNVIIYHQGFQDIFYEDIKNADVVGISSTTSTIFEAYKFARIARKYNIPVILGGIHVSFLPDEALQYCDFVVRGEGEETILELIELLETETPSPEKLQKIMGLSFNDKNRIVHNPARHLYRNLDVLPFPDFSLLSKPIKSSLPIPIMTSRGCPFGCTFCSVTAMFGRGYRFRSEENILEELKLHDEKKIFFCDDNFTAKPERTINLLNLMMKEKINLAGWSAQTRTDVVKNKELLNLMQKTNCKRVYIGFESVNPQTLKSFNKQQTVTDIENSVQILHSYNINVHGMFVLGSDEDDFATIQQTLKFTNQTKIDTVQLLALVPLPGTQSTQELETQNRVFSKNWTLYDGHHVLFQPKNMTPYQLQVGILNAMRQFYTLSKSIKYLLKGDFINAGLQILAKHFINKGKKYSMPFIKNLKTSENNFIAEIIRKNTFAFNENAIVSYMVKCKNESKERLRTKQERLKNKCEKLKTKYEIKYKNKKQEILRTKQERLKTKYEKLKTKYEDILRAKDNLLKINIVEELRTKTPFIYLSGTMDFFAAKQLKKKLRKTISKDKTTLVINFANVKEISPRAVSYLAKKFSLFDKRRKSVKLLGLDKRIQNLMESISQKISGFEFFESEEMLTNLKELHL